MFENLQQINPMGLSESLADFRKIIIHKNENVTSNLNKNITIARDLPNRPL